MVDIPLGSFSSKHMLEQSKMEKVIRDGVRRTPHVKIMNMVSRILSSKTFKLGDV